jgi:hypothetical protein
MRTWATIVLASLALAGCTTERELEHGAVGLRLVPSEAETCDVFGRPQQVRAAVHYGQCIAGFYDAHPEYAQDGELGAAIFGGAELGGEGWSDRLCEVDLGGTMDCTVIALEQVLGDPSELSVTLGVGGDACNRMVPVGPLPTAELAGCTPCVEVAGSWGIDGNGSAWEIGDHDGVAPAELCVE